MQPSGERDADQLNAALTLLARAEASIGIAEGLTSDGIGGAIRRYPLATSLRRPHPRNRQTRSGSDAAPSLQTAATARSRRSIEQGFAIYTGLSSSQRLESERSRFVNPSPIQTKNISL